MSYNMDLVSACAAGKLDIIQELLTQSKAHVDYCCGLPLGIACENGHLDVVRYLLTSPELKQHATIDIHQHVALIKACTYNKYDVVKYLISSEELTVKADVNAREGMPLIGAASKGNKEICQLLIEHGADIAIKDYEAFVCAVENNHLDLTKYFLSIGADIHAQNDKAFIYQYAYNRKNKAFMTYFIDEAMIEYTKEIQVVVKKDKAINSMFLRRELEHQLKSKDAHPLRHKI